MQVNIHKLVKECIREVLKENLLEGHEPTSAGPNPASCEQTQHDPYKAWNAKMRKMEESLPPDSLTCKVEIKFKNEPSVFVYTLRKDSAVNAAVERESQRRNTLPDYVNIHPDDHLANMQEDVNYGSDPKSTAQLHHQLVDIDAELKLIYSYIKHGKSRTGSFAEDKNNIEVLKTKKQEILRLLKTQTTESGDHGRYAQQAGAGQFDPRTFGVNEADKKENIIYKEIRNGKDIYWVEDEINGGTTALSSTGVAALIRQGYKIVELDADPRSAIRQPDPDMANYMGDGDRT